MLCNTEIVKEKNNFLFAYVCHKNVLDRMAHEHSDYIQLDNLQNPYLKELNLIFSIQKNVLSLHDRG